MGAATVEAVETAKRGKKTPACPKWLDPEAKKRLIELWEQAYEEGNLKELPLYLDETKALLQESQELNFKRWNILNQKVHMNFQALGSYDAEVQYLRNCLTERLTLFDQYVRN